MIVYCMLLCTESKGSRISIIRCVLILFGINHKADEAEDKDEQERGQEMRPTTVSDENVLTNF